MKNRTETMLKDNLIADLSVKFVLRIISLVRYLLRGNKNDIVLGVLVKQVLRSGTSIGANIHESKNAQSKADFINKINISLKEADETEYWLGLLYKSDYLSEKEYNSIFNDNKKIIGILVRIIKTSKNANDKPLEK